MITRFNRFLSGVEWRLSLGTAIWGFIFPATSFALPAWAARAAGMFSTYAPLSWVLAGFVGLFVYAASVALFGYGRSRAVRSRYDASFLASTGGVDPMSRVFESKRIFLNDFVLPSNPVVVGKTFVDCEIVGPANVFLERGNSVDDVRPGLVDAVALSGERPFYNGFLFRDCKFRGCTFHRVTLFLEPKEALNQKDLNWLNWISAMPQLSAVAAEAGPSLIEHQKPQSPKEIAEETQP